MSQLLIIKLHIYGASLGDDQNGYINTKYSWQWITSHKVSRAKMDSLYSKLVPRGGI